MCIAVLHIFLGVCLLYGYLNLAGCFWVTPACPAHPSARHGVVSSVSAIPKVSYAFQACPSRMPRVPPQSCDTVARAAAAPDITVIVGSAQSRRWSSGATFAARCPSEKMRRREKRRGEPRSAAKVRSSSREEPPSLKATPWHHWVPKITDMSPTPQNKAKVPNWPRGPFNAWLPSFLRRKCEVRLLFWSSRSARSWLSTVNWERGTRSTQVDEMQLIRWCSSQGKRHKSRSAEKCGHAVRSSWDCRWNQMFFSNCPFLFWGPVSSLSLWPSDPGNFLSI